jgi:predicted enzyme related to lactoylglutathione lyase
MVRIMSGIGDIAWADLTVHEADGVRDFYRKVVGWKVGRVAMGGYNDYGMIPPGKKNMAAGVCHARGVNADLPPVWLIYIVVKNLRRSIDACLRAGGSVIAPPRPMGKGTMCVIADPAGAISALYQTRPATKPRRKR